MIRIITVNDGSSVERDVRKSMTFKEAQKVVGGYVEVLRIPNGAILLVNDEGLIRRLPYNRAASFECGRQIVGDAVLLTGESIVEVLGANFE